MEIPLVCFSHLRWHFVFQRPQHLMTRFAAERPVFFVEEPIGTDGTPGLDVTTHDGVTIVVPRVPPHLSLRRSIDVQRSLLKNFFDHANVDQTMLWFYTPMALPLAEPLLGRSRVVVFDCMDELTGFQGAPAEMAAAEANLLAIADVVFTGGESLYQAKRSRHANVHCFPSAVDQAHFAQAPYMGEPDDQQLIGRPRVGFCGVIDERMDLALVDAVARRLTDMQFVMIGPVAKIDAASLPRLPNVHYLGPKPYAQLPGYFGGWNVAIMPFAHNAATRYISPTKTPEYLSAGVPVVSTSIADVVRPYGANGFVKIADRPEIFCRAIEASLLPEARHAVVQAQPWIRARSWDRTFTEMLAHIEAAKARRVAAARRTEAVASPLRAAASTA